MDLSDERNPLTRTYDLIPVQDNGRTVTNIVLIPSSVTCTADIQQRDDVLQIRVLPNVVNDPPPGYIFESYVADPETVGVTGDGRAISELGGVARTMAIDLSDKTETFTVQVPLDLPDGVSVVPDSQMISVTVTISAVRSSRQFQEVPVEITGLDPTQFRATVLPNAVTVLVAGPEARLPDRGELRVTVDLSGLSPGNHQVAPSAEIIDGSSTAEMSVTVRPEQLTVTIEPLSGTPTPGSTISPDERTSPPTPAGTPDR
jgi:YbbR domain-containing protein